MSERHGATYTSLKENLWNVTPYSGVSLIVFSTRSRDRRPTGPILLLFRSMAPALVHNVSTPDSRGQRFVPQHCR